MAGEAKVEDYLKRRVKETGGHTRKVKWLDRLGAPDRLVWWQFPACCFVEVKAPGEENDLTEMQAREHRVLRETGWPVLVLSTMSQVDEFIEEASLLRQKYALDRLKRSV